MTDINMQADALAEKIWDNCDSSNVGGTFDKEKALELIKSALQSYGDQKLEEAAICSEDEVNDCAYYRQADGREVGGAGRSRCADSIRALKSSAANPDSGAASGDGLSGRNPSADVKALAEELLQTLETILASPQVPEDIALAQDHLAKALVHTRDNALEEAAECCDNRTEYGDIFAKQIRALKSPSGEKS